MAPDAERESFTNRQQATTLLAVPLWLAVAGSVVEVCVFYARKRANPLFHLGEDFVWMAPLALVGLAALPALLGAALARVWPRRRAETLAVFGAGVVVWTNLLLLLPRLAHAAVLLLAAGLALQTTRLVIRHPQRTVAWMRRSTPWLLAGLSGGGVLMWLSLRPAAVADRPVATVASAPNVILITLDTVRAASLSLYGYPRPTTPALDAMAARGVVFDQAFTTAPWTLPSHAGMFTGRWAHELSTSYTTPLDGAHPTLAEYFTRLGYRTGGFVANLGYCSHGTGLGRGFQHYEDYPRSPGQIAASSTLVRTLADNFRLRRLLRNDEHLNRVPAAAINRRVLDWLPEDGRPFFVFLNYFDAHEPYLPPPPFDRRFGPGRARGRHSPLHHWLWNPAVAHGNIGEAERREEIDAYDGAIAALDQDVGVLLRQLEARDRLANTILVITSDHGEEFGEHGIYDHGYSLYRAGLHVPLVIVAPDRVPSGRRIVAPVSLRDLAATIVDLVQPADRGAFPGQSLAPLWTSSTPDPAAVSPVFAEAEPSPGQPDWFPSSQGRMHSVIAGDVRYIRNGDGREELYDLVHDPWEKNNLVTSPARRESLDVARSLVNRLTSSGLP